jgi:hypothetical protein
MSSNVFIISQWVVLLRNLDICGVTSENTFGKKDQPNFQQSCQFTTTLTSPWPVCMYTHTYTYEWSNSGNLLVYKVTPKFNESMKLNSGGGGETKHLNDQEIQNLFLLLPMW